MPFVPRDTEVSTADKVIASLQRLNEEQDKLIRMQKRLIDAKDREADHWLKGLPFLFLAGLVIGLIAGAFLS